MKHIKDEFSLLTIKKIYDNIIIQTCDREPLEFGPRSRKKMVGMLSHTISSEHGHSRKKGQQVRRETISPKTRGSLQRGSTYMLVNVKTLQQLRASKSSIKVTLYGS